MTPNRSSITAAAFAIILPAAAQAQSIPIPGTSSITAKVFAGFFEGGRQLQISASGTVDLYSPNAYLTHPDGSLAAVYSGPLLTWVNVGAAYPTFAGGDGINHYPGGGTNWQGTVFNVLGAQSTDTTNPATIRFGTLVGTFSDSPAASDWFVVGTGTTVTTPPIGGRLYLAVTDCDNCQADNTGSYQAVMQGAAAAPYNVEDQFSAATNPSGAWSYGFKLASDSLGTFTAFTHNYQGTIEGWDGATQYGDPLPGVAHNRSNSSASDCCSAWLPGELLAHPGTTRDCVLRFTAPPTPAAATYRVSGWLRGISLAGTTSGGILVHRGQPVFSADVVGYQTIVQIPPQRLELLAGESIDLIITKGPNGNYSSDSTGVNLLVSSCDSSCTDKQSVTLSSAAYLRADSAAGLAPQAFTIETWFRPDGPGSGNANDSVGGALVNKVGEGTVGSHLASWGLYWSSGTSRIYAEVAHAIGSAGTGVVSNAVIPMGTLTHCALTFDGTTLRLYVNGRLNVSTPAASSNVAYLPNMPVLIGASNYGVGYTRRFQGLIDEVRIWDHARTPSEIVASYACALTSTHPGLLAAWSFDGSFLTDVSGNGRDATSPSSNGAGLVFVIQPAPVGACIPACPADFNGIGGLTVADIFAFLTAWFSGSQAADFNGVGGLTVSDIFAFLTAWFGGCP